MDQRQEQDINALDSAGGITLAPGGVLTFLVALRQVIDTPVERLPKEAVSRAAETLAQGAVLCCLTFIVLSFLYPDKITASLTVISPVLTVLFHLKQKGKKDVQP